MVFLMQFFLSIFGQKYATLRSTFSKKKKKKWAEKQRVFQKKKKKIRVVNRGRFRIFEKCIFTMVIPGLGILVNFVGAF